MADYGAQDTSTTTLGANQFPISEAWTPNAGFSAVEGGTQTTDAGGKKSAPVRVEVKDGSDVAQGLTTDAAVTGDNSGTLSAKLRGLTKIFTDIWDSVNHRIKVDGSGVTQPVSGTFWQATQPVSGTVSITANSAVNVAQIAATTTDTNSGLKSAGTQRIVLATDQPQLTNAWKVDGSAVTQPVSGTFWQATQPVSGTVTTNQGGTWTVQPGNTANTTAWKVDGSGVTQPVSGTFWQATQPVSGTITANQGGTWTVQPGNTANTTPWLTSPQAATSGGATPSHTISAATTNATSLKGSAGQVYGLSISNTNAAARFFKLFNKASAPTLGTDTPVMTLQVPANATVIRAYPVGLALGTGIAWAATGAIADADATAIGAGDLSIDIDYK